MRQIRKVQALEQKLEEEAALRRLQEEQRKAKSKRWMLFQKNIDVKIEIEDKKSGRTMGSAE